MLCKIPLKTNRLLKRTDHDGRRNDWKFLKKKPHGQRKRENKDATELNVGMMTGMTMRVALPPGLSHLSYEVVFAPGSPSTVRVEVCALNGTTSSKCKTQVERASHVYVSKKNWEVIDGTSNLGPWQSVSCPVWFFGCFASHQEKWPTLRKATRHGGARGLDIQFLPRTTESKSWFHVSVIWSCATCAELNDPRSDHTTGQCSPRRKKTTCCNPWSSPGSFFVRVQRSTFSDKGAFHLARASLRFVVDMRNHRH